jgi:4-hydroxy-tetrahydrodipicolinate synthase
LRIEKAEAYLPEVAEFSALENAMNIPTFKGIITVITTPFDAIGKIDFTVLDKHIDFLVGNGVHAIMPGGSTGEYYAQSTEERRQVLSFVAEKVAKRVPIYAGAGSMRPAETIELANYAKTLGYEAIMLTAPPYSLPNTEELAAHFRNIAANTSLPIILYNFPARTGVDMHKEFLDAIADVKAICAIKESSGSLGRYLQHVILYDGRFQRICGFDDQALDHFLWGTKSWIAGASNFLPAEHVALYDACVEQEDWKLGKRLMTTMMPLIYLLENGGKYIQYVKYGCELAGIPVGAMRPPMGGLTEAEKSNFHRLYDELKAAHIAPLAA